jgi:tRNA pseudouridine38-40 synthase
MFEFLDKAAMKVDDLLLLNHQDIKAYIEKNQSLFKNLVLDFSPSNQTAYGYNQEHHAIKISYESDLVKKIVLIKDDIDYQRFKLTIQYDGHLFKGFQKQKHERTIQGELSKVINPIALSNELVQGSSRTDAHVHANLYVCHFDAYVDIDEKRWLSILNHQLAKDIKVLSIEKVHPLFHARYDVIKKTYIYKINTGEFNPFQYHYQWFVKDLNIQAMKEAIKDIIGHHDFSSFSKDQVDDPIRHIYEADIKEDGEQITIKITGNGFHRYMIRLIVDYLVKIGKGANKYSLAQIIQMKSRKHTTSLAPANGLYLDSIIY